MPMVLYASVSNAFSLSVFLAGLWSISSFLSCVDSNKSIQRPSAIPMPTSEGHSHKGSLKNSMSGLFPDRGATTFVSKSPQPSRTAKFSILKDRITRNGAVKPVSAQRILLLVVILRPCPAGNDMLSPFKIENSLPYQPLTSCTAHPSAPDSAPLSHAAGSSCSGSAPRSRFRRARRQIRSGGPSRSPTGSR